LSPKRQFLPEAAVTAAADGHGQTLRGRNVVGVHVLDHDDVLKGRAADADLAQRRERHGRKDQQTEGRATHQQDQLALEGQILHRHSP
jgi:hypothetical protein